MSTAESSNREAQHLAEAVRRLVSDPRNGWLCPFTEAVAGLGAAQAAWVSAPGTNGIWALVNHIRIEAEVVARRLQGLAVDYEALGDKDGWSPAGTPDDESGWRAACGRAITAHAVLTNLVAGMTDEQLACPIQPTGSTGWYYVHAVIAHTLYHTGQIVLLRRLQGSWQPDQWLPAG